MNTDAVFFVRSAIGRARQKKLLKDTNKICATLQSKELYNAKDEEEVLFHNDNITHLNGHVFLDSGTKCSSKHDIQRFSYPTI